MRVSLRILLILVLLLAGAALALPYALPHFIFRPDKLERTDPRQWGLTHSRHVRFRSVDGSLLSAWWTPPAKAGDPVVLVAHGRSANISTRAPVALALAQDGFGSLMFDYRGYGASEGEPSEQGIYEDSLAAHNWLSAVGVEPERLIVLGQSLGNAPAARLAAERLVGGLVLISPFTSFPEAAGERLPWLPIGLIPWRQNRFEVAQHLHRVSAPVLLVSSRADDTVPFVNSAKLRCLMPRPPHWIEDRSLAHNGLLAAVAADGRLVAGIRGMRRGDRATH